MANIYGGPMQWEKMDINGWLYNVILIKVYDNSIKVKKVSMSILH
jgi:hypothetical protein